MIWVVVAIVLLCLFGAFVSTRMTVERNIAFPVIVITGYDCLLLKGGSSVTLTATDGEEYSVDPWSMSKIDMESLEQGIPVNMYLRHNGFEGAVEVELRRETSSKEMFWWANGIA